MINHKLRKWPRYGAALHAALVVCTAGTAWVITQTHAAGEEQTIAEAVRHHGEQVIVRGSLAANSRPVGTLADHYGYAWVLFDGRDRTEVYSTTAPPAAYDTVYATGKMTAVRGATNQTIFVAYSVSDNPPNTPVPSTPATIGNNGMKDGQVDSNPSLHLNPTLWIVIGVGFFACVVWLFTRRKSKVEPHQTSTANATSHYVPPVGFLIESESNGRETKGAKKHLYTQKDDETLYFMLVGVHDGDPIPPVTDNVPLLCNTVSRNQGKLTYNRRKNETLITNFVDGNTEKNPIAVNSKKLMVGETVTLEHGALVSVGRLQMRYYEGL